MKALLRLLLVPLVVLLLDQLTKLWVVARLPYGARRQVWGGFFDLVHVRNRGVAFGLFADGGPVSQAVLLLLVVLLSAFVAGQLWRLREQRFFAWALGLILGGACGNLADRLLRGEVVDFLDFYLTVGGKAHHWPAFNLADAAVSVGAVLLLGAELLHRPGPRAQGA